MVRETRFQLRFIQKIQEMVLDASLLNTQQYKVETRGKWTNPKNGVLLPIHIESPLTTVGQLYIYIYIYLILPGKGVAPSPTPCCSSHRKGSLRVALDYGRQLYTLPTTLQLAIYLIILHKPILKYFHKKHLQEKNRTLIYFKISWNGFAKMVRLSLLRSFQDIFSLFFFFFFLLQKKPWNMFIQKKS